MKQEYLSDIELYFSNVKTATSIALTGDEFKHITKVMRHSVEDTLHITDGNGMFYKTTITEINKSSVKASIVSENKYQNELKNIFFCFPRLKNTSRFEFELEKSIELGITNFIIFNSERTIPKGEKLERWNKISLAAMKQSLRTYLPKIEYVNSIEKVNSFEGEKIVMDQKGDENIIGYLTKARKENSNKKLCFIFGPEGGLSPREIEKVDNYKLITLTKNRLRAETAVISTASAISLF